MFLRSFVQIIVGMCVKLAYVSSKNNSQAYEKWVTRSVLYIYKCSKLYIN